MTLASLLCCRDHFQRLRYHAAMYLTAAPGFQNLRTSQASSVLCPASCQVLSPSCSVSLQLLLPLTPAARVRLFMPCLERRQHPLLTAPHCPPWTLRRSLNHSGAFFCLHLLVPLSFLQLSPPSAQGTVVPLCPLPSCTFPQEGSHTSWQSD